MGSLTKGREGHLRARAGEMGMSPEEAFERLCVCIEESDYLRCVAERKPGNWWDPGWALNPENWNKTVLELKYRNKEEDEAPMIDGPRFHTPGAELL